MPMTRAVSHGSGPAAPGMIGPCQCDRVEGQHYHGWELTPVAHTLGDRIVGAEIVAGSIRPVFSCGCNDHPRDGAYYTSARRDDGRFVALSGPYASHAEALDALPGDREWTHGVVVRAPWLAYGTFAAPAGAVVKVARAF